MNYQNDYLVLKAHIDDLVGDAERARMARGARRSTPTSTGRGLVRRLRHLVGRCPDLTVPELRSDCP
ncbi:MAG: hypothetical protein ACTHMY_11340 [Solirubrobacteraceae bacterium]